MTNKIVFYILTASSLKERDLYACRIIEKLYNNQHKIYIHTNSLIDAQNFVTQLWTFSDISFIPHEIYNHNAEQEAPILIGFNQAPNELCEILINLTADEISFYQQFKQLIEIIPNDPELKEKARARFQSYKKEGILTEVFNL